MEQLKLYIKDSYNELVNKVTWPSWPMLQQSTVAVLVGTLIFTAVVYILGAIAKWGLVDMLYNTPPAG